MVLNVPEGVSRIVPIGTRESFPAIAVRMFPRIVKAASWLLIVENVPSHTCPRYPTSAIPASSANPPKS